MDYTLTLSTDMINTADIYRYISIPVVAGFVGWITNWLAIQLMFHPQEFIGIKPLRLGWQGVIPSKARKMAKVVVNKGLNQLAGMQEVFESMDKKLIVDQLSSSFQKRVVEFVDELMKEEYPVLWENLPNAIREPIYKSIRKQMPVVFKEVMDEFGEHIDEFLDLEDMVGTQLSENKELLNQIFWDAGKSEFKFIIQSGAYFGVIFGLIQMITWIFFPEWWILPLFGLLVGYFTNVLALRFIFQPLHPLHYGPVTLQGIFLKRQHVVARVFCEIATEKIITLDNILVAMLTGPRSEKVTTMIQDKIISMIENSESMRMAMGNRVAAATMGTDKYHNLKKKISEYSVTIATEELMHNRSFAQDHKEGIKELLIERMISLSPEEFQDLLRPAFKEDELTLILVGAVLGMLAGIAQLYFIFGGQISF